MKSKAANLLEMLMGDLDMEFGEESPMQQLIKSILDKAEVHPAAYKLADYGLDVLTPEHGEKILQALLAGGLKATADNKGKIVIAK